jgi:metal-responsive CopG/Arc/MetJ family transcriptional regulator
MAKKTPEKRKYTTITIPTLLFNKLQGKIEDTSFSSVSDYVTYILRETITEMELGKKGKKDSHGVVEKLRALGYTK